MNQNYHREYKSRVSLSMNREYDGSDLLQTPSVKNVMINDDKHQEDEFLS